MTRIATLHELDLLRLRLQTEQQKIQTTITTCAGTGCQASLSLAVLEALKMELGKNGYARTCRIRATGCHGFCEQGPIMIVDPGNVFYCRVTPEDVPEILSRTVAHGEVVDRLLYTDPISGKKVRTEAEIPFYRAQDRQILAMNRQVDPRSIEDYLAIGGYSVLAETIDKVDPERIIKEVKTSGLRGRGGGGFPTGRKWEECRAAAGDEKYVICNADEGDPGAYMDRCVLEGNPHLVIEGMMIGAYAIGAQKGYIYVRNEYPLAVKHARIALEQARTLGILGENILGTSFSFDVEIARGGGAFVCGESTALMASLEGKVGEPRPKDVHTVVQGLWQMPTTLNNVETWANIPLIMREGSAWFASKGTKGSKGTKILALTGHVKNTGLVEVAMGTPLQTIVFDIGGGGSNGRAIKAVQTGGPSGGCLPVDRFDLPVDFDLLAEAGSMVGSGGMVVMDEKTCMVDVAKYFLTFLQDESCGKCVPCRLGIDRMLEITTDISEGRGTMAQLGLLKELAETVKETSLCGLGKTAPNPVLSTLRYFAEEYETHINHKKCPAGVCQALITYAVHADKCTGCGICKKNCPSEAIQGTKKEPHSIDPASCSKCGICASECKFDAISAN